MSFTFVMIGHSLVAKIALEQSGNVFIFDMFSQLSSKPHVVLILNGHATRSISFMLNSPVLHRHRQLAKSRITLPTKPHIGHVSLIFVARCHDDE